LTGITGILVSKN